eukprot:4942736-Amphidinium_carterae.1
MRSSQASFLVLGGLEVRLHQPTATEADESLLIRVCACQAEVGEADVAGPQEAKIRHMQKVLLAGTAQIAVHFLCITQTDPTRFTQLDSCVFAVP